MCLPSARRPAVCRARVEMRHAIYAFTFCVPPGRLSLPSNGRRTDMRRRILSPTCDCAVNGSSIPSATLAGSDVVLNTHIAPAKYTREWWAETPNAL
eukprot:1007485-Pyramimonas_sp.AAC.1